MNRILLTSWIEINNYVTFIMADYSSLVKTGTGTLTPSGSNTYGAPQLNALKQSGSLPES